VQAYINLMAAFFEDLVNAGKSSLPSHLHMDRVLGRIKNFCAAGKKILEYSRYTL
jgi:hypothetical protein